MNTHAKKSASPAPLISVVIVTYNAAKYIDACLTSVLTSSWKPLEIIVVDNASTDNSLEKLKKFKQKITLYALTENIGYTGGNNYAAARAQGKYAFFLNPDTKVTSDVFGPLVSAINRTPKVVACQPAVYLLKSPKQLNLTGKVTQYLGFDWLRDFNSDVLPEAGEITSLSGSGFLIDREMFLRVGAFDENFFLYFEDSDLSWRLRLLGYKLWFEPKSNMYHDYKYIPDPKSLLLAKKLYYYERNRLLMLWKNYSYRTLIILAPMLLCTEIGMLFYCALHGALVGKIRGYVDLALKIPTMRASRSWVQTQRVVSDAELMTRFALSIDFKPFLNPATRYILNPIAILYYRMAKHLI